MTSEMEAGAPRGAAPERSWSRLALAACALAGIAVILAVLAAIGTRWGIWHFRTGFGMLRWAVYGGIAAAVLSGIALYRTRPGRPLRGMPIALAGLLIGLLVVMVPWRAQRAGAGAPPIHDISTDLENPPPFVAVAGLRSAESNPIEYGGEEVARMQRSAYPDIRPVILDVPIEVAYQSALEAARAQGWRIVDANPQLGVIEATDRTFWFGFHDDVVVRLTPLDNRTVVDVRSKSRLGRGDLGANARRVRAYLQALAG
jgi:uncharacterized protein (DUF1499 family)